MSHNLVTEITKMLLCSKAGTPIGFERDMLSKIVIYQSIPLATLEP